MNIQNNYTYQILNSQFGSRIQRIQDNAFIPNDPNNCDYQSYQAWVSAGNTAPTIAQTIPAPAPVYATESEITNLQTQITALQAKVGINVSL